MTQFNTFYSNANLYINFYKKKRNYKIMDNNNSWNSDVEWWLRTLRYSIEQYDLTPCNQNIQINSNNNKNNMEKCSSSIYENIWECRAAVNPLKLRKKRPNSAPEISWESNLNFAQIHRLSVAFDESVEELNETFDRSKFEQIVYEISEDVMLWKLELRYTCSSEDEEEDGIFESQSLLKTITTTSNNDDKPTTSIRKFPVTTTSTDANDNYCGSDDIDVEIRKNVNRQQSRSKTYNFDTSRSNDVTFKVHGLISVSNPEPFKLSKHEYLLYERNDFFIVKDTKPNQVKKTIDIAVAIKSIKDIGKQKVELKVVRSDRIEVNYLLSFDSAKEKKAFMQLPEIQHYIDKSSVSSRLNWLLRKRPSRVDLEKKGIYQNEPIFDNYLTTIYKNTKGVPEFVIRVIEIIERPENITSLGLYRANGNLATMQKIRTEVDKGMLNILQDYVKDIDVLTGCLKLFFRELKEPLISLEVAEPLLDIFNIPEVKKQGKINSILKKLPEAHLETLVFLFNHLLKVEKYKDQNKMDMYNLAVCWAPTIIGIQYNSQDIIKQSADITRIFEFLLNHYKNNPLELNNLKKRDIHESRESLASAGSSNSLKRSNPVAVVNDPMLDVIKKLVELIEQSSTPETLYQKSGSKDKIDKIIKKIKKNKLAELDKYKADSHDLADVLKRYIRELPEPLLPLSAFEKYCQICDNPSKPFVRQEMIAIRDKLPRKDALICLLKHIRDLKDKTKTSEEKYQRLIQNWRAVFSYNQNVTDDNAKKKYEDFLEKLITLCDATAITPITLNNSEGHFDSWMPDLVQQLKDRGRARCNSENAHKQRVPSTYDNCEADEHVRGEASILDDEKTEYTKL